MMRKKIVSQCMALVLCLGLLPVTALAVEGAPHSLYVGNTSLSLAEDSYWTTDPDTGLLTQCTGSGDDWNVKYELSSNTLTLNKAKISGSYNEYNNPFTAGIYAKGSSNQSVALTIELIGTNTITGNYGIYVDAQQGGTVGTNASLLIQNSDDDGSLEVSGSSYGIYVKSGTGDASLTIKNASVDAKTTQIYSSYAGVCVQSGSDATSSPQLSLAVNGGSLTTSASEGNDGIQFYVGSSSDTTNATTSLTVSNNAIVDARNGGISASRISVTLPTPTPTGDNRSGIVFDGSTGTVYGSVTLQEDLTIGEDESLTLDSGASLDAGDYDVIVDGGTLDDSIKNSLGDSVKYAPTITTTTLTDGRVGEPYSASLGADGTAPITWSVSGSLPAGLTLNNGGMITGTPTTVATSTFTVTATNAYGSDSRELSIKISPPDTVSVTGVTLDKDSLTLTEGNTAQLTATVKPDNATNKNVTWTSSDETVATVTDGLVTALKEGTATITVTTEDGSKTATCAVTVTAATVPVTGVTLSQTQASLYYNRTPNTLTLTATVAPDNATNQAVTWTSSDSTVAAVDQNGVVTALARGTAVITATAADGRGASASCTVTVSSYLPPANPNYRITVEATQGGTVTADPTAAKAGTTVTLTPVPDRGYQVGTVAVTDRFGEAVAVTEQAGGTYTFTMPNGQVTVTVTFAEAPLPFPDVTEGDWFYDAVRYAYENGLMDGVGDNLFAPNSDTTRAQLVTILYRLEGQPAPSGDSGFSDVAAGTWYTDAVAWAAENGIVNGVSETEFAPGKDITREQLATILFRYAEAKGYDVSARVDLSAYPDANQIQSYAAESVAWAVAEGLIQGFEDNTLRPAGNATRAQIATILMRFCEGVAK